MPKKYRNKPERKRRWDLERDADTAQRDPKRYWQKNRNAPEDQPSGLFFDAEQPNAVVVSPYGVLAFVDRQGEEVLCRVDERLTDGKTSFLCPGDQVFVEEVSGQWWVRSVAPRKTVLQNYAEGKLKVIAANVDGLLVVASVLKPRFKPGFVDRCLIAAEASRINAVVCLNKIDLTQDIMPEIIEYEKIGLPVIRCSCVTGEGLERLRDIMEDKTIVLCGQSGVGKSSLIKALSPELDIAIGEVSRSTEKGRHTTTASRLYRIPPNIRIIDTPGVKTLGIWGVSADELDYYFPEFRDFAASCRFRDCTHQHEPACAVREALERGEIIQRRYESYKRIRENLEEHQEKQFK